MEIDLNKEIINLPKLKLAVIGHVEWVTFLKVDQLPLAGEISHAKDCFEEAAGGAAGVGRTTTKAVVWAMLGIFMINFLITNSVYSFGKVIDPAFVK